MPYEKLNDPDIEAAIATARQLNALPPELRGQSVSAAPTSISEDVGRWAGQALERTPDWFRAGSDPNKLAEAVTSGMQMLPPFAVEQAMTDTERGEYGSAALNAAGVVPFGKLAAPAVVKAMAVMPRFGKAIGPIENAIKDFSVERKLAHSGMTSEDFELRPEITTEYAGPAMLWNGQVYPGSKADNHATIAERMGFPKGMVPGFVTKDNVFHYQYAEDIPPSVLDEKQFRDLYSQHIDLRSRGKDAAAIRDKIIDEGWKPGFGVNTLPIYDPRDKSFMSQQFAPKKGDMIYFAPSDELRDTGNGLSIKEGWKPKPYETAIVEYDNQNPYELYLKAVKPTDDALKAFQSGNHPIVPDVAYHGTASDFSIFKPSTTGEFGPGMYFTSLPEEAAGYAGTHEGGQNIMPVRLRLKNPYIVQGDPSDFWAKFGGASDEDAMFNVMAAGHDGIVFERPYLVWDDKLKEAVDTGKMTKHIVVFSPNQIKSSIGNAGRFDPAYPDITKSGGGPVHDADIDAALHTARQHFEGGGVAITQDQIAQGIASAQQTNADRKLEQAQATQFLMENPDIANELRVKNGQPPIEPQYGPNIFQSGYDFIMGNGPDRQPLPAMDVPAFQRPVYDKPVAISTARWPVYQTPRQADTARRTSDFLANRTAIGQLVQGAYQSAKDAFTLPGRAYMGEVSPDQMIPEALNFAGFLTGGAGVVPMEANSLRAGAGLFSKAERVAADLPMEKMQGPQALAMLSKFGVGPEELKWTGLADRLAGTGSLTKDDLLRMIRENDVQLGETNLGFTPIAQRHDELLLKQLNGTLTEAEAKEYQQLAHSFDLGYGQNEPKYLQYSIPGGKNYRETLITLPPSKLPPEVYGKRHYETWIQKGGDPNWEDLPAETKARIIETKVPESGMFEKKMFSSLHWNEPNVVAHIRTNEFAAVNPEGGPSLKAFNLDELQSDWAQKGRKKGFVNTEPVTSLPEGIIVHPPGGQYGNVYAIEMPTDISGRNLFYGETEAVARANALDFINRPRVGGVPTAPYVQSTKQWADLGLKKAVSQALDSGSDVFTWTPGVVNADRYSLAHHLKRIEYEPNGDGTFAVSARDKNGVEVYDNDLVSLNDIEDLFGKDMAEKIKNDQGTKMEDRPLRDWRYFEGDNLKGKGDGMIDFYDNIVPQRLSEVIRKATGEKPKFEKWTIQTADGPLEVQGFRFTPEMKAKLQAVKEKQGGYFPHMAYGGKVEDSHSVNKALQIAAEASV